MQLQVKVKMNIDEKISKIEPKIKEPSFLENKGLSMK